MRPPCTLPCAERGPTHSAEAEGDRYLSNVASIVDPMDLHARGSSTGAPAGTPGAPLRPDGSEGGDPTQPRWLFKVVDVCSDTTLVEDASAFTTVAALQTVESIFDVWIFVWIPDLDLWRQLTPGEHRLLWNFRGR